MPHLRLVPVQDKSAVLEDTRGIIAEQLGKELADVRPTSCTWSENLVCRL